MKNLLIQCLFYHGLHGGHGKEHGSHFSVWLRMLCSALHVMPHAPCSLPHALSPLHLATFLAILLLGCNSEQKNNSPEIIDVE